MTPPMPVLDWTFLRVELVQVAAVAVAMVEQIDYGQADLRGTADITIDVEEERVRQQEKWGVQNHPIELWLAILMEEVGEAAQAFLETRPEESDR